MQRGNQMNYDKTSNNKYFGCPAMMADGRIFTDYRPNTYVNDLIRVSNNINSSYDYRQFLMHNARNIMEVNNKYTTKKIQCEGVQGVYIPNKTVCVVNDINSKCQVVDERGMGLTNTVLPNTVKQLGMEGKIHGMMCRGTYMDAMPLVPEMEHHKFGRFN